MGRKKTIIAVLALSFGSVSMEVVSTTNPLFFAGKLVNGVAVGVLAAVCATYIGEVTPLALRGLFTCAQMKFPQYSDVPSNDILRLILRSHMNDVREFVRFPALEEVLASKPLLS